MRFIAHGMETQLHFAFKIDVLWGDNVKRELDGKQFTCIELSFIRFCMDRIIWSMMPNEIYHDGEIVHVRERAKHILKVTNELLKEIDEQFKE